MKRKRGATEQTQSAAADATQRGPGYGLCPSVRDFLFMKFDAICNSRTDASWPHLSMRNALAPMNKSFARTGGWSHFVDSFQRSFAIYLISGAEEPWQANCVALYTKVYSHFPDKVDTLGLLLVRLCDVVKHRWAWRKILDDLLQGRYSWLHVLTPGGTEKIIDFIEVRSSANHETFKSIRKGLNALRCGS